MEQFLAYLLQSKAQLKIVFPCDRICRNRKSKTDYSNKRIVYTCVAYLKNTGQGDLCTFFTYAFAIVHK